MKAKLVSENIAFKRNVDPRKEIGVGSDSKLVLFNKLHKYCREDPRLETSEIDYKLHAHPDDPAGWQHHDPEFTAEIKERSDDKLVFYYGAKEPNYGKDDEHEVFMFHEHWIIGAADKSNKSRFLEHEYEIESMDYFIDLISRFNGLRK